MESETEEGKERTSERERETEREEVKSCKRCELNL